MVRTSDISGVVFRTPFSELKFIIVFVSTANRVCGRLRVKTQQVVTSVGV